MADPDVFTVILAGGSGTRFWPASLRSRPKQLLALGPSPQALIAATARRVEPLCPQDRVLVATGKALLQATRQVLDWLPESAFLGEPRARNTAPCIGWAAAVARRRDPNAVVAVLPSDQHIEDVPAYLAAVALALHSARQGVMTTIGIKPSRPETGFGYIEAGDAVGDGVRSVARFVEKPDRARAEEYLTTGRHFWNSGMFFFRAEDMLSALEAHAPAVYAGIQRIEQAAVRGPADEAKAIEEAFEQMPSISIDYAVMEHMARLNVVPADFGWSDLGSWEAAWELGQKDEHGNVLSEDHVVVDARDNLVRTTGVAQGKVVALLGVEGLCVVDTGVALLVMPKDRSQDVRSIVEALEAAGRGEVL